MVDRDHLARLHVADKLRSHDAERAGLAAEDIACLLYTSGDGVQHLEEILLRHVRSGGDLLAVASAMLATEIASERTFPEELPQRCV